MRVFVTGASGWVGSAVVPDLLAHDHQVVGLARSDASADKLAKAGAEVLRGGLEDLDSLRTGARDADAVVHLAYDHDFSEMEHAGELDRAALRAIAEGIGSDATPFAIAAGLLGVTTSGEATENDMPNTEGWQHPRIEANRIALGFAEQGIPVSLVRLAPTVHGAGDWGFIARYVEIAREKGVAGYIGDGANRWAAVHRSDAAPLFRFAIEQPAAGAILHAAAENVEVRAIAEAVGRQLDLPATSIPAEDAEAHFGWLATFLGVDGPASSALTRERYGWTPTGPTLLEDLAAGSYPG